MSGRPLSLKARLLRIFLVLVPLTWMFALGATYLQTRKEIAEIFDTEQSLFARQLLAMGKEMESDEQGELPSFRLPLKGARKGAIEERALGFALFDKHGDPILADGEGRKFPAVDGRRGFYRIDVGGEPWHLFFLSDAEHKLSVVVGQPYAFRNEVLWEVVANQLLPWLVTLPVLLLLIVVALNRGLAPLSRLAGQLAHRQPYDSRPLDAEVPSEAQPLVDELNRLFARVAAMLTHERRFTADAAHELRTPLSALKVQAEVAMLAQDEATRARALSKLMSGIDRASRLTEQLLALSRLDPLSGLARAEPLSWREIVRVAVDEVEPLAEARASRVVARAGEDGPVARGDALLMALLLRNLLDNALRYGREGGTVEVEVTPAGLVVRDDGPGVPAEYLERVRERFFRPPGQEAPGSGLGLSIVERIAELHGLALSLENRPEGGLAVSLARCDTSPHSARAG